jgi:hypothetical protein
MLKLKKKISLIDSLTFLVSVLYIVELNYSSLTIILNSK